MPALEQLLMPQVLTRVISRVASTSDWLTNLFGVTPVDITTDGGKDPAAAKGKNIINEGHGRYGAYHVYNNVRAVAQGRAPGSAAGRRRAQGMARVPFTYPRMHDSVSLSAEVLHNLGQIQDPAQRDVAGAQMIKRQTNTLGQLAMNWRKAMLVGALRDSLYLGIDGDAQFWQFTNANNAQQVNFQMPAGNKAQLNMLGGGNIIDASWATTTTDIPGHLGKINAAFQQLCGGHLSACICGTKVWNAVIRNEVVAAIHGSANPPFLVLERDSLDPMIARTMKNVYRARLSVYPDVTWYITDEGLEIGKPGSETFTKMIGENEVAFIGHEPDDGTLVCYEGSEPIAEYDSGPETVKVGLTSWSVKKSNPTTTELFILDNALIVPQVPQAYAYATVIGF
jgi:hypothetical protein